LPYLTRPGGRFCRVAQRWPVFIGGVHNRIISSIRMHGRVAAVLAAHRVCRNVVCGLRICLTFSAHYMF
jgi:hypothetical protein